MGELQNVSTDDLLERAQKAAANDPTGEGEERWELVRELHRRGERPILITAAAWCRSQQDLLRRLGADVLGQLGFKDSYPFAHESEPILLSLLHDPDDEVVSCALVAFGHLGVGDPAQICELASHASCDVRYAVAYCLSHRGDPLSRETLIVLSSDPDSDVRDWATFGLGALIEVDGPHIREALVARLTDEDDDVRGEAMVGLALRGDTRALPVILEELNQDEVSSFATEAACEFPNESFLAGLEALLEANPHDPDIVRAVKLCRACRERGTD